MYFKIIALSALVAYCQAGYVEQGHGQAVSSQSIVRHDQSNSQHALEHPHPQHAPLIQHSIPVLQHSILEHNTPLVQHSFLEHGGSLVQAAPIVHHLSPAVHQSTILQHAAPLASYEHADQAADHASAKYEFSYSVEDPHTGDHKSHHESSDGDVVRGEYSLLQPDGSIRKVEYTADDHNGFNAVVHNSEPNPAAAQPTSASAHSTPLIQSAPVHSAPFVHSGPVVHSAPIVHAGPLVHAINAAPTHYFTAHH